MVYKTDMKAKVKNSKNNYNNDNLLEKHSIK